MDIKIEEKGNLYTVQVEVPNYNTRIKRKTIVHTSEVRRQIEKKGYQVGKTIEASYIHNANGVTNGTWVFEKKNLDKSAKDVILEEKNITLEEPAPKSPPKRKRRTSTKKKTVEE